MKGPADPVLSTPHGRAWAWAALALALLGEIPEGDPERIRALLWVGEEVTALLGAEVRGGRPSIAANPCGRAGVQPEALP